MSEKQYTFIDLFAGIGGFHLAMHANGAKCVFASEWDKFARQTYEANFYSLAPEVFDKGLFAGDINKVAFSSIPDFDILCAGFPCQPFSSAGLKKASKILEEHFFFRITEIVKNKVETGYSPKVLFLENVKGLLNHDKGRTFGTICSILDDLGYRISYKVLNARNFGVPQNRERIFIVAWRNDSPVLDFHFPLGLTDTQQPILKEENMMIATFTFL